MRTTILREKYLSFLQKNTQMNIIQTTELTLKKKHIPIQKGNLFIPVMSDKVMQ